MDNITKNTYKEKLEQIERGKRIKNIREQELHMSKTKLAQKIGVSSQFLSLVEEGKGNLVYRSIKKLRIISGHSSDYILYGLDDSCIKNIQQYLYKYTEEQIILAIKIITDISHLIENLEA